MAEGQAHIESTSQERNLAGRASRGSSSGFSQVSELQPRDNREAITAGINFLFSQHKASHWIDFTAVPGCSDTWVTAFVLAELAAVPGPYLNYAARQQMQSSAGWLLGVQGSDGGWGFNTRSGSDAESTAWAMRALRGHRMAVPESAAGFIQRCRRSDGGIGIYPAESPLGRPWKSGHPDVTALVVGTLGVPDGPGENFLRSCWLQTNRPSPSARVQSRFYPCAMLLEWEVVPASWPVLEKLCELMSYNRAENAFDQALLLRCLTRLHIQKASSVAAGLRRMQRVDGGWQPSAFLQTITRQAPEMPESACGDDQRIVTTAAAVSALARSENARSNFAGHSNKAPVTA